MRGVSYEGLQIRDLVRVLFPLRLPSSFPRFELHHTISPRTCGKERARENVPGRLRE